MSTATRRLPNSLAEFPPTSRPSSEVCATEPAILPNSTVSLIRTKIIMFFDAIFSEQTGRIKGFNTQFVRSRSEDDRPAVPAVG